MDLSAVFFSILESIWWVIPIILCLMVFKTSWFKGLFGEAIVAAVLRFGLNQYVYNVLHDVTLETEGGTTQIDHVIISHYGVFIIETKHMSGWIFGQSKDKTWMQTLGKRKYRFQNPLRQNYRHVKAIEQLLDIPTTAIHPLVVFTGSAEFKLGRPDGVVSPFSLVSAIKAQDNQCYIAAERDAVLQQLQLIRLPPGRATDRLHRASLRHRL